LLCRGCKAVDLPFVKARRAIELACRNAEAPLRRAERAASWAMEFMMIADGIDDGEWSFGCRGCCPIPSLATMLHFSALAFLAFLAFSK
jgi:hypothetical protein